MSRFHVNSSEDDPYIILGVERNCSQDDIKRAFKRLALLYHPDKCHNDDSMFKRVNNAYQILFDVDKRKQYDFLHSMTYNEDFYNSLNAILLSLWYMILEKLGKQRVVETPERNNEHMTVRPPPIVLKVSVPLKDVYNKQIKKIHVRVKRTENDELVMKTIPLFLSLLNVEQTYTYKGMGDEWLDSQKTLQRGDIIIVLSVEEHAYIKVDKYVCEYDLYIERGITLYQLYYGLEDIIDVFGEKVHIQCSRTEIIEHVKKAGTCSYVHVLKAYGLPYYDCGQDQELRGDLYVFYRLDLPVDVNLNSDFEFFLKEYFNDATTV